MREPSSSMDGEYKKGLWSAEEDALLVDYIRAHGKGRWNRISQLTGLKRRGKSCRLRWMNYLSPSVKRGEFSEQEDDLIIRLHKLLGNRWSLIAGRLPGRTDNQVKNYWNIHLSKKLGVRKPGAGSSSESLSVQRRDKGSADSSSPALRSDSTAPGFGASNESHDGRRPVAESGAAAAAAAAEEAFIMNGSCDSSFWILAGDSDLCAPMEQLDDGFFDFIWDGL